MSIRIEYDLATGGDHTEAFNVLYDAEEQLGRVLIVLDALEGSTSFPGGLHRSPMGYLAATLATIMLSTNGPPAAYDEVADLLDVAAKLWRALQCREAPYCSTPRGQCIPLATGVAMIVNDLLSGCGAVDQGLQWWAR